MSITAILQELRTGPKTNAELGDAVCEHSGSIARSMAKLLDDGRAVRIDGAQGRGSKALYALANDGLTRKQREMRGRRAV